MSLFNKLKGALNKLEDVKEVIEIAAEQIQKVTAEQEDETSEITTTSQTYTDETIQQQTYNTDNSYFETLVTEANFPGYSITTDVHVRNFDTGAHPSCYPITYLFSKGTQPVLAVLIMNTNQYRSMIARGTYKVLDENNIPYIRFFKGMENKSDYVISRIKENLK